MREWSLKLTKELNNANHLTAPFQTTYNKKVTNGIFQNYGIKIDYKTVVPTDLVKEMSDKLEKMFDTKEKALAKSVEFAEECAKNHTFLSNLTKVEYINAKEIDADKKESKIEMDPNIRFLNKEVNLDQSAVHIPVEIYDGNIEILNGLKWTTCLDKQFKINYENDSEILWQYFGSQTGFMRSYPATQWTIDDDNKVDLYDVRRQSWYTQGSTSPKDMMIMVDKSGSTHGESLQLMKNAVKSILDTLGENDFVNIVQFSDNVEFVSPCFNETPFVQANFRNKKQLERDVDKLKADNQANFTGSLEFVFKQFKLFDEIVGREANKSEKNFLGAQCNKVIMLLTDGGNDYAEEVFNKYNWIKDANGKTRSKKVRVFTYAVGKTPNPISAIRWMACSNRGYYSAIPAMGAIRASVQTFYNTVAKKKKYTDHLRGTVESSDEKVETKWEATLDPRGMGMMTTVTRPVYNTSGDNQTILGVMGIDMTTAELEAKSPYKAMGPNGYAFAINSNGYVVFHPNMKRKGRFMKEPPNVDIIELEVHREDNDKIRELRDDMVSYVEKDPKGVEFKTLFLSKDRKYVTETEAKYAYTRIGQTTFTLGISIPKYQKSYMHFSYTESSDQFIKDLIKYSEKIQNNSKITNLLPPWKYRKDIDDESLKNQTLMTLLQDLKDEAYNKIELWDDQKLMHLYWDLLGVVDSDIHKSVFANFSCDCENSSQLITDIFNCEIDCIENLNEPSLNYRQVSWFFQANSGLLIYRKSGYLADGDSEREDAFYEDIRNPDESSIFKRALLSDDECILQADDVDIRKSNSNYNITDQQPIITMACALEAKQKSTDGDKPIVVGFRMTHDMLLKSMKNSASAADIDKENNGGKEWCSEEDEMNTCYLVDDGGFVVATNAPDMMHEVGEFLGEVDPALFGDLQNKGYFFKTEQYNFQDECGHTKADHASGFKSFYIPSINLLYEVLSVSWWSSQVSWAFTSFNLINWLFTPTDVYASPMMDMEEEDHMVDGDITKNVICVKRYRQFHYNLSAFDGQETETIACREDTGNRSYTMQKLEKYNLVLIVAQPIVDPEDQYTENCKREEDYPKIFQEPTKLDDEQVQEVTCRYSKRMLRRFQSSSQCFNEHDQEEDKCGCAAVKISTLSLLVVVLTVLRNCFIAS